MAMIAKKAGISAGLAYNYFESKEDLLKELFSIAIENFNAAFGTQPKSPTKEDCIKIFETLSASVKSHTSLWRLMVQIMLQPNVAKKLISGLRTMPGNPLLTFKRYFEMKNDADPESRSGALMSIVIGVVLFHLTHEDEKKMKDAFNLISKELL